MAKKDKKSFFSIFEETQKEKNGHSYLEPTDEAEEIGLTDELDHEIFMHRDAHFAGDFEAMLDYYRRDGIGVNPYFDLDRIENLANLEKEMGHDLSPLVLNASEAERVSRARYAYQKLKEIYAVKHEKISMPRLFADLILTEEEEPEEEIEAVIALGEKVIPDLIHIVESDEAFDPLFPGYGFAPYLAARCLGKLKSEKAIQPLFETLGTEMQFDENEILEALFAIGESAKTFLLRVLRGRPLTQDNIHAAFALAPFAEDQEVMDAAAEQLQDPEVREKSLLTSYLEALKT